MSDRRVVRRSQEVRPYHVPPHPLPVVCVMLTLAVPLAVLGADGSQPASRPEAERGTVLHPTEARRLFPQCSRPSPPDIGGYWTPSRGDIARLEADLGAYFSRVSDSGKLPGPEGDPRLGPLAQYFRQYVGLLAGGRRIVYVNAFSPQSLTMMREMGTLIDWRHRAIYVCDGGPAYFGVEYDVARRTFSHFAFNGVLGFGDYLDK